MEVSAGIIITDKKHILGCLPNGRQGQKKNCYDIPKGRIEEGENPKTAAIRECKEETGLVIPEFGLKELGLYPYIPTKNLHLFILFASQPAMGSLHCTSKFMMHGTMVPEVVGYKWVPLDEIETTFFSNLVKVIKRIIG
jgi:8-oxo-dGTP pyrophosphatase MutT (NUDIX family)